MPNHLHAILSFEDGHGRLTKLGSVVGAFKTVSTNRLRHAGLITTPDPIWQRSFYERVTRTESQLQKIRQCILDNPIKWALDPYNPANWDV
jgi:REP element-mobilizing transposase RayT